MRCRRGHCAVRLGSTDFQLLASILNHRLPTLIHKYTMKEQEACPLFAEFVVPVIDPAVDGYDLRGLTCRYVFELGWRPLSSVPAATTRSRAIGCHTCCNIAALCDVLLASWLPDERTVACYNGNIRCPPHVTPLFLEEGKNQGVCSAERDVYFCNVKCTEDGNVLWEGSVCPNDLVSPCPPWKRTTTSASKDSQSTILPLPSSPHWAPTTATFAMAHQLLKKRKRKSPAR